ncbi:MAG TPA: choice-of-anchor Q domain-containing protein, partial [Thermomicrobiales bacterium]
GAIAGNINLIDDGTGTLIGGANNLTITPALLGTPGSYGGQTQTFALLPGSRAIDAGAAVGGGPVGNPVPAADQRGKPRVGSPDIGAFESQGFTLTIASGDNPSKPGNTAFAPLVVTVAPVVGGESVNGGVVTFTGSGSGADIAPDPQTATIGATTTGQASITPTAIGQEGGPYTVVAAVATGATPPSVAFSLTNIPVMLTGISPASGSIMGATLSPSPAVGSGRQQIPR